MEGEEKNVEGSVREGELRLEGEKEQDWKKEEKKRKG